MDIQEIPRIHPGKSDNNYEELHWKDNKNRNC